MEVDGLLALGCELGQGRFFAAPGTAEDLEAMLRFRPGGAGGSSELAG